MYSHCISCRGGLGRNQALDLFSIGRRLAFDPLKGRLWVVCPSCRNWNLVPLEDRWEAIEEAEHRFSAARIEASASNIAVVRLADGSELVRIGDITTPEFASWRYSRQVGRRYRTSVMAGGATAGGAVALSGLSGLGLIPIALTATGLWAAALAVRDLTPVMRTSEGHTIRVGDGQRVMLYAADNENGWRLGVPRLRRPIELEGQEALRALRRLLPRINLHGGDAAEVAEAATHVATRGASDRFIRDTALSLGHEWSMDPAHNPFALGALGRAWPHRIATAMPAIRLALEMAVNELCERRLVEGDLVELGREWREAEELATISDDLLLPAGIGERLRGGG